MTDDVCGNVLLIDGLCFNVYLPEQLVIHVGGNQHWHCLDIKAFTSVQWK